VSRPPAWLVKGTDELLRERVLDQLVAELLGGDDRSLALEEITVPPGRTSDDSDVVGGAEGREQAVAAVLNAAGSPPFMTSHRIVVVRDVGLLTAADAEPLVRYLDDPLDSTVLVLVHSGGKLAPALAKKLKELHAPERAPDTEATDKVLIAQAHEHGVLLSKESAELIARHLGDDAGRVVALVEVLSAAFGPDERLSADDVRPYLGEEGTVAPYLLTNAIEEGDIPRALELLHRVLTVTSAKQPKPMHPLQVMGVLTGYYRRVLRLDDPGIRGEADAVAALGGKVKPFPAKKALAQARALGSDGIRRAFDALARADLDLKGASGMPEAAVMEVLVVRLCRLSGEAGGRGGRGQSRGGPSRGGRARAGAHHGR
jgi:DNA polymerase-3 subunit delta